MSDEKCDRCGRDSCRAWADDRGEIHCLVAQISAANERIIRVEEESRTLASDRYKLALKVGTLEKRVKELEGNIEKVYDKGLKAGMELHAKVANALSPAKEKVSMRQCLDEVYEAGGKAWDDVDDPEAFIRELRGTPAPAKKDDEATARAVQEMKDDRIHQQELKDSEGEPK